MDNNCEMHFAIKPFGSKVILRPRGGGGGGGTQTGDSTIQGRSCQLSQSPGNVSETRVDKKSKFKPKPERNLESKKSTNTGKVGKITDNKMYSTSPL